MNAFAYFDPSSGAFSRNPDDMPRGATIWPLQRVGDLSSLFPPAASEITGKWCWSTDEESYRGQSDSEGEAHGDAIDALESDGEDGETRSYWIARCCHPLDLIDHDKRSLWAGENFLEQVEEWCADEVGAEDAILDMTADDKVELGRLVLAFIRSRAKVQYYGIKNAVEHKHVIGSNDGGE